MHIDGGTRFCTALSIISLVTSVSITLLLPLLCLLHQQASFSFVGQSFQSCSICSRWCYFSIDITLWCIYLIINKFSVASLKELCFEGMVVSINWRSYTPHEQHWDVRQFFVQWSQSEVQGRCTQNQIDFGQYIFIANKAVVTVSTFFRAHKHEQKNIFMPFSCVRSQQEAYSFFNKM